MQKECGKKGGFSPSYALNNKNIFNCFGFPVFPSDGRSSACKGQNS